MTDLDDTQNAGGASSPTVEQIRAWDRTIRSGGSVSPPMEQFSYICAIVRRAYGLGVDPTDSQGVGARAYIDEVLGS